MRIPIGSGNFLTLPAHVLLSFRRALTGYCEDCKVGVQSALHETVNLKLRLLSRKPDDAIFPRFILL